MMLRASLVAASVCMFVSIPLFAKGSMHCHKADGAKMVDVPEAKDQASCDAAGGLWAAHEPHCHVKDGEQWIDEKDIKTKKDCLAKKGEWQTDHPVGK